MAYNVKVETSDQYLYEIVVTGYCKQQAIDEAIRKVKRYYTECGLQVPQITKTEAYPQGFRVMYA